jgi:hypothetical protein
MSVDQDAVLQDAKDILTLKPELTTEEKVVADKLRPQLKAILRPEVRLELEAEYIKKYKEFEQQLTATSREAVQKAIADWQEDQKPLSQDDIRTLLAQEYMEFDVKLKLRDGQLINFHLVELPQEIELRFIATLKKRFLPLMKELIAAEFKLDLNSSSMEKLQSLIEAVPGVLEVFTELVAICLDPWGDNKEYGIIVNAGWVKKNIATHRILAIILGQLEVGRYRDFFLNGFRLSKSLKQSR